MGVRFLIIIVLGLSALVPTIAVAQQDVGPLPRVLIIGDSVYQQPAGEVAKALAGRAEVVYRRAEPGEICNSSTVLRNLENLLDDQRWDLIHLNVGLGDLVYRAPGMDSFRVMARDAGGIRATNADQYRRNLEALTERLQQTGASLIWAQTTPIRHSRSNVFELGSERDYNAIAKEVMQSRGIPINDMYGYVVELIDMERPASHGADPFFFDRQPLHPPIVRSIETSLGLDSTDVP